jgi:Lsr2
MAQKINIVLSDDLDGSMADETVSFSLDGVSYELDLSSKNGDDMRKALEPFIVAARRVSRPNNHVPAQDAKRPFDAVDSRAVRAWAASNQVQLSPRGRIPASVLERFRAAGH